MISHGNGFAADAYFPYWQRLLDINSICWYLIFAIMGRAFRSSPRTTITLELSRDLELVVQEVRTRLGHKPHRRLSSTQCQRVRDEAHHEIGWRWDALVLFDPPDVPPPEHPVHEAMRIFEVKSSSPTGPAAVGAAMQLSKS